MYFVLFYNQNNLSVDFWKEIYVADITQIDQCHLLSY
jgi:hypothetical protein